MFIQKCREMLSIRCRDSERLKTAKKVCIDGLKLRRVDASKCVAQVYRYLDGIYMSVKCLYRNDEDLSSVYMDNLNCVTAILRYCEDLEYRLVWIWNGQKEVEWPMV